MSAMKVLIVEDESIVAMEIENLIVNFGYSVVGICSNAKDALTVAEDITIDIVLMDICLKGDVDGIETAEKMKKIDNDIQIIFLTAHMDDYNVDRAIALDPVAYLSKPFNQEELRVSLKIATMKRHHIPLTTQDKVRHIFLDNEFCYDTRHDMLYCCNEPIHLTKKESELMELFMQNKNKITDLYLIEQTIWPNQFPHANTLRTLVKRLREKLKHKFIETVPGRGYKFTIDPL